MYHQQSKECRKNELSFSDMCGCENCEDNKKDEKMFLDCQSGDNGDDF